MEILFQVDEIVGWREEYDESIADSDTAVLTLDTKDLRHKVTVTELQDGRWLNEIFRGCRGVRVTFDESEWPQYRLEVMAYDGEWEQSPVASFKVDTQSRSKLADQAR